ncbi:MAG: glycosyltransferase family 39 protein [Nitrospinae bacterium]|nr:glycosyltransferase family 39 protein [Nitrospinota bacterium]
MKDKNLFIALLVSVTTFILLFLTIDDMGPTWDELYLNPVAAKSFAEWIKNSVNGFLSGDFSYFCRKENIDIYFRDGLHYHPPFGRILHALSYLIFNGIFEEFEALRMSPMIMFSILAGLLYLSIAKFYDRKSGIFAVISLITMPRVFGHAHLFALDTPIMFMWFLTVYCFMKGLESRVWSPFAVIAWGLAMDTKAQGYLIFIPVIIFSISMWFGSSDIQKTGIKRNIFFMIFISPIVVYLANPWLWHYTFENFSTFSTAMKSHAKDIGVTTYYLGTVYHPSKVPWHYPYVMTFVTTPPITLILSIIGGLFTAFSLQPSAFRLGLFFLINALAAVSMLALPFAPKYDGVRLILSAFPFIAGLSGIGFYYLHKLIDEKVTVKGFSVFSKLLAFSLFMIILLFPSIKDLLMIRPYYLAYYNSFTGGVRGARDSGFETTYWGDPLNKKFIEYLNSHFDGKTFKNRTGYHRAPFDFYHDKGLLSKNIKHDWEDYDYYMLNMRQSYFDDESWFYYKHQEPVYSVNVQGIDLVNIYRTIEKPAVRSQELVVSEANPSEVRMKREGLWKGLIAIKEEGEYGMGIALTGRAVISIDNSEAINESRRKKSFFAKQLKLSKGFHQIEIEYSFIKEAVPLLFLSIKPLDRNFPLPYFRD